MFSARVHADVDTRDNSRQARILRELAGSRQFDSLDGLGNVSSRLLESMHTFPPSGGLGSAVLEVQISTSAIRHEWNRGCSYFSLKDPENAKCDPVDIQIDEVQFVDGNLPLRDRVNGENVYLRRSETV